jgi:hypothetical protein
MQFKSLSQLVAHARENLGTINPDRLTQIDNAINDCGDRVSWTQLADLADVTPYRVNRMLRSMEEGQPGVTELVRAKPATGRTKEYFTESAIVVAWLDADFKANLRRGKAA